MTIRRVFFGGIPLVHGTSWMPLIGGDDENEEVATLISQHDVALQVRMKPEDSPSPVYGFVGKDFLLKHKAEEKASKKKSAKEIFSMGAVLAGLCRERKFHFNAIFLIACPGDSETIMVVVVQNGIPASGGEYSGPTEEVRESITPWLRSGIVYSIYSDNNLFHESAHPFDAEAVFADCPDGIKKAAKFSKAKANSDKKKLLAIVAISLAVTVAMWGDIVRYLNPPPPPPPPPDFAKMYSEGLQRQLMQTGDPGSARLNRMLAVLDTVPVMVAGWRLDLASCDPVGCTVEYVPKPLLQANNQTFMDAKPADVSGVLFAMDGNRISARYGNPDLLKAENNTPIRRETLVALDAFQQSDFSTYQDLRRAGVHYTFEPPVQVTVEGVPIGKVPPGLVISRGGFTLIGKAWALKDLSIANNMVVSEIAINAPQAALKIFTIKGFYYVK